MYNNLADDFRSTEMMKVVDAKENKHGELNITITFPNLSLLEEFHQLKCSLDLLAIKVFPNVKEITEAMGVFSAVKKILYNNTQNTIITVVGDGSTPRLGALCAFRTPFDVISVDPALKKVEHWEALVKRLKVKNQQFQTFFREVPDGFYQRYSRRVWMFPHAHINMDEVLKLLEERKVNYSRDLIVVNPCCVSARFDPKYYYCFGLPGWTLSTDKTHWGIHSPSRRLITWKFINEPKDLHHENV